MQNQPAWKRFYLHHLLFWMIFFGVWYYLRFDDYSTRKLAVTVTLIKVVDLALMIYVANYLLIPRLLYKKKYLLFGVVFLAMIIASSLVKMQVIGQLMQNERLFDLSVNLKARIYDNMIPHFLLVCTGAAFKLILDYTKVQQRLLEMAKEKAEAELGFLKSQINPHFLFNSLNAVYFLIDKQNADARNALHKFSAMLRYQLYECNGEKIPMEKETEFLKDYVAMQQLRTNKNSEINFWCSPDVKGFSIEPLLLIPFVENSFKHLSHFTDGRMNKVNINVDYNEGSLHFNVYNTTEEKKNTALNGGIGLANVKRRLELLYPSKHMLDIKKDKHGFTVDMKILVRA